MRICILGAGIVGLATAWRLHHEGFEVTVIDRASAGQGASAANGAQLSYAYVQPLADPSLWRQLPRLLLASDSPLMLRPQFDLHQWSWILQFLAACRSSVSKQTTLELLALAAQSRIALEELRSREQLDCDFSASGKLVLYPDADSFAAARRQMVLQKALGTEQMAVTAQECVALEPALAHHQPRIAGAIYTPGECAADCQKVCHELHRLLSGRGVQFILHTDIERLVVRRGRAVAVRTASGPVEADAFVVALGAGAHRFGRDLSLNLPVYPLRGYSLTMSIGEDAGAAPTVNVTDAARKVVFARLGRRLRVAGMVELAGYGTAVSPDRIAALSHCARDLFPKSADFKISETWAGLRPATPTGRPILGPQPGAPDNLLFNVGQGALGFTLAFGCAQQMAVQLQSVCRAT